MLLRASLAVLVLQLARTAIHLVVPVVLRGGVFDAVSCLLLVVVSCDVKVTAFVFKFDLEICDAIVFRTVGTT